MQKVTDVVPLLLRRMFIKKFKQLKNFTQGTHLLNLHAAQFISNLTQKKHFVILHTPQLFKDGPKT